MQLAERRACDRPDTAVATRENTILIELVQAELETQNTRDNRGGVQREAVSLLHPFNALRQKLSTPLIVLHLDGFPFHINQFGEIREDGKASLCAVLCQDSFQRMALCCKTATILAASLVVVETLTAVCTTGFTAHV